MEALWTFFFVLVLCIIILAIGVYYVMTEEKNEPQAKIAQPPQPAKPVPIITQKAPQQAVIIKPPPQVAVQPIIEAPAPMPSPHAFIAVDMETANRKRSSICQIGMLRFDGFEQTCVFNSLIDPEEPFDEFCISIHNITPDMVVGKPTFNQVYYHLVKEIGNTVVVSWTNFDKQCLEASLGKYGLPAANIRWLDASIIAREVWPKYNNGYKLKNVAKDFGIIYQHHDATEDARACGIVVKKGLDESGIPIEEWYKEFGSPVKTKAAAKRSTPVYVLHANAEPAASPSIISTLTGLIGFIFLCCIAFSALSSCSGSTLPIR
jgi:DNA polymerase III epsilon subunit-like protein